MRSWPLIRLSAWAMCLSLLAGCSRLPRPPEADRPGPLQLRIESLTALHFVDGQASDAERRALAVLLDVASGQPDRAEAVDQTLKTPDAFRRRALRAWGQGRWADFERWAIAALRANPSPLDAGAILSAARQAEAWSVRLPELRQAVQGEAGRALDPQLSALASDWLGLPSEAEALYWIFEPWSRAPETRLATAVIPAFKQGRLELEPPPAYWPLKAPQTRQVTGYCEVERAAEALLIITSTVDVTGAPNGDTLRPVPGGRAVGRWQAQVPKGRFEFRLQLEALAEVQPEVQIALHTRSGQPLCAARLASSMGPAEPARTTALTWKRAPSPVERLLKNPLPMAGAEQIDLDDGWLPGLLLASDPMLGDTREARRLADRWRRRWPDTVGARWASLLTESDAAQLPGAWAELTRRWPRWLPIHLARITHALGQGDLAEAGQARQQARARWPENPALEPLSWRVDQAIGGLARPPQAEQDAVPQEVIVALSAAQQSRAEAAALSWGMAHPADPRAWRALAALAQSPPWPVDATSAGVRSTRREIWLLFGLDGGVEVIEHRTLQGRSGRMERAHLGWPTDLRLEAVHRVDTDGRLLEVLPPDTPAITVEPGEAIRLQGRRRLRPEAFDGVVQWTQALNVGRRPGAGASVRLLVQAPASLPLTFMAEGPMPAPVTHHTEGVKRWWWTLNHPPGDVSSPSMHISLRPEAAAGQAARRHFLRRYAAPGRELSRLIAEAPRGEGRLEALRQQVLGLVSAATGGAPTGTAEEALRRRVGDPTLVLWAALQADGQPATLWWAEEAGAPAHRGQTDQCQPSRTPVIRLGTRPGQPLVARRPLGQAPPKLKGARACAASGSTSERWMIP